MVLASLVAIVLLSTATEVAAQPEDTTFSIQLFQPAPGPSNFFTIEAADIGPDMTPSVGLLLSYQHRPFVLLDCTEDGECVDGTKLLAMIIHLCRWIVGGITSKKSSVRIADKIAWSS